MPKGRCTAREVVCRACERPFVTDRCGKAAFYCRRPECEVERARAGTVIANRNPAPRRLAGEVAAQQVRGEAIRARAAMRRVHEEALRMDRDRDRARREQEKSRRETERAERAVARRRAKADRERAVADGVRRARVGWLTKKVAGELVHVEAKIRRAVDADKALHELRRELAMLEGRVPPDRLFAPAAAGRLPERAAPAPRPAAALPTPDLDRIPAGELKQLLAVVQRDVLRRCRGGGVERRDVHRAVVRLANAEGVKATRDALHELVTVALSWEYRLTGGGREIGQVALEAADTEAA